ncbi:MAG: hypothetical protein JO316_04695 [Abitibacteriaceae bacterium]|nr:hypothetical protein [Abditibacteriaceae bacterium]
MRDGTRITTREQWQHKRKPELKALFQHYMYGYAPAPPKITATLRSTNDKCLNGKATLKQISITLGPRGCPPIELMVVVPNHRPTAAKPAVFIGMNFGGNHSVLADPTIELPKSWMPAGPGVTDNHATDAGRGKAADAWAVEHIIDRGYAVATFFSGDVAPDRPDFNGGVFPYFPRNGHLNRLPWDWGVIAAWAWGLQRAVDYLVKDKDIDPQRIILFGHSRNGKAALLAGAFDERVAAIIPHQAGCGGSAPSRCHNPKAETVTVINNHFPHWFDGNFHQFSGHEEQLPFDQHELIALCAPRPVLLSNGSEDQWSNPPGQFDMLLAARPVYRLFGVEGMADQVTEPVMDKRVGTQLCYYIRDAKHMVDQAYWDTFMDFADQTLPSHK